MILSEYDAGDANWCSAIGRGSLNGERRVIFSTWEGEDMDNLSVVTLPIKATEDMISALSRAVDGAPPDWPGGRAIASMTRRPTFKDIKSQVIETMRESVQMLTELDEADEMPIGPGEARAYVKDWIKVAMKLDT